MGLPTYSVRFSGPQPLVGFARQKFEDAGLVVTHPPLPPERRNLAEVAALVVDLAVSGDLREILQVVGDFNEASPRGAWLVLDAPTPGGCH